MSILTVQAGVAWHGRECTTSFISATQKFISSNNTDYYTLLRQVDTCRHSSTSERTVHHQHTSTAPCSTPSPSAIVPCHCDSGTPSHTPSSSRRLEPVMVSPRGIRWNSCLDLESCKLQHLILLPPCTKLVPVTLKVKLVPVTLKAKQRSRRKLKIGCSKV